MNTLRIRIPTIVVVALALALALLASGCGQQGAQHEFALDMDATQAEISQEISFEDTLFELSREKAPIVFSVDPEMVVEVRAFTGSGGTAEEYSIWQAKSEADAEAIEAALREHLERLVEDYSDYRPAAVPRLKSAVLERNGCYVIDCVTDDVDAAKVVNALLST